MTFVRGAPSLFKYLMRDHAEALVETGELRISTLYDLQDEERYGDEIGDKEEGLRTVYSDEDFDIDHVPEFARGTLIQPQGHKNVEFRGIEFRLDRTSPNLYTYSTCQIYERRLLLEFKYDACVEILDTYLFFTEVTRQLKSAGYASELLHLGPCHYQPRREHHSVETKFHPAMVKAPKYSHQREVRAVWQPSSDNVKPVLLTVPEVRQAVKLVPAV
jgi:hypothetical protein